MDLITLKDFFLWFWICNLCIYLFSFLIMFSFEKFILKLERIFLNLEEYDIRKLNAYYLASYKLFNIIFGLTPWLSLVILTNWKRAQGFKTLTPFLFLKIKLDW